MADDKNLHADIAALRTDLQNTNRNLERMVSSIEKMLVQQGVQIREVEHTLSEWKGVIALFKWLGPSLTITVIYLLVNHFKG